MLPEPVRLAAHVLVDVAGALGDGAGPVYLAARDLGATGAVEVLEGADGGTVVEVSDLAFAGAAAVWWLLGRVAEATGEDRDEVAFDLRRHLDGADLDRSR